ncbi:MAG TPA: DUF937 domain-containing protein [Candidatus Limnocylindria bacterium]|nr:DUF937 domain-containing protein [Candidatus Limnocylindria bacterium]
MAQNSTSILDDLRSHLSGDTVNEISRRIGADPAQTQTAIDGAIPMLLAALGKEAADPSRSAGLHQAIQEDHDGSIIDNLQAYLNGEMGGRAADGQGIVNHVLGDRQEPAVQALAGKSGLDLGTIASLLPLLAPIVMGMIGKKQGSGGLSMDSITDVLGGDTQRAANQSPDIGDLLGSVLGGGGSGGSGGTGGLGDVLGSIFGKG